jgi:site-specific DNA-methyltransferase (adenine-specific)
MAAGKLYYGDNLQILRDEIADDSVDLIYLDPPFNSQATYNLLFRSHGGEQSQAQVEAFEDTWKWEDGAAEIAFDEVIQSGNSDAAEMLRAMRSFMGESDLMAYLAMMTVRLLEMQRVLNARGSLYLHCDPTASHYLKVILDGIFGPGRFLAEIIWKRTNARGTKGRWPWLHDVILVYAKDKRPVFHASLVKADQNKLPHTLITGEDGLKYQTFELTGAGTTQGETGRPWRGFNPAKYGRHWGNLHAQMDAWDAEGLIHWPKDGGFPRRRAAEPFDPDSRHVVVGDVWTDIDRLNQAAKERLGYPTQKPLALLERIIQSSTDAGGLVLDPFCGCGTTIHAAQKLGRRWIGIDVTHLAISLIEKRLNDAFPGVRYEVEGTPTDMDGARALAAANKYQFQWWAVSLVGAVPYGGRKKGADSGIDGFIYFKPDGKTTERAIVSVKGGGNVQVGMIRDLGHVVDREKAKIGVFVTLAEPTEPMRKEAVKAGFYIPDPVNAPKIRYPKIQLITIAELFAGKKPAIPLIDPSAFRKANKEDQSLGKQASLL